MDRRQRRFLACLTLLALGCLVVQAVTGDMQLAFHLTPLFLLVSLLLSGHYLAEDRIVAAWLATRPPAPRRRRTRWTLHREIALASLLDRSPLSRRGPPAPRALATS